MSGPSGANNVFGTPAYSELTKFAKIILTPLTSYYDSSNLYINSVR